MLERASQHSLFITKVYSPTPTRRNETICCEMARSPSALSWLPPTSPGRFTGPQVPLGIENIVMDTR